MVGLAVSGVRELIFRAIPLEPKKAIAIGIGLFIAFIGLYNSGIIAQDPSHATPVGPGSFTTLAGAPFRARMAHVGGLWRERGLAFAGDPRSTNDARPLNRRRLRIQLPEVDPRLPGGPRRPDRCNRVADCPWPEPKPASRAAPSPGRRKTPQIPRNPAVPARGAAA
jgi:hypothetical protein